MDWLNLLGRAVHVVAGIAWIGASFYFIWLDNHLQTPADAAASDRGVGGELWAMHGGGFYHAQKYRAAPPVLPARLHWFMWEAYTTFLSGLFLLAVVYYAQAELYMVDRSVAELSPGLAVAIGIAWIVGGWLVYDALCRSPLGRNDRALAVVLAVLCAVAAYALCHLFPGRAAFVHFGAMLGTIMVLNVFFIIIPGQRALLQAARDGPIDPAFGLRGKQRSVHNTYFTLPVVFTMLANHYAWIFGAAWNWVWLITISAAAALIRAFFVARHRGHASPWPLVAAAALLAATAYGVRPSATSHPSVAPSTARVQSIVAERCVGCHAATPRFPGLAAAPKGVALEHADQLRMHAALIRAQVASRAMPPGNVTGLTDAERAELIAWLDTPGGSDGRP